MDEKNIVPNVAENISSTLISKDAESSGTTSTVKHETCMQSNSYNTLYQAPPELNRSEIVNTDLSDVFSISDRILDESTEAVEVQESTKMVSRKFEKSDLRSGHCFTANVIPYTEVQLAALYRNSELEMLEDFMVQYVEAELKGTAIKQHPLYELLMNYLHAREKVTGNTLELNQFRKEYAEFKSRLWSLEEQVATASGDCQDGTRVIAKHLYNTANFHRSVFQTVVRVLTNIRNLTNKNHILYSYSAELFKLQVSINICKWCIIRPVWYGAMYTFYT